MGVWEYKSIGVWEYRSIGVWECGVMPYALRLKPYALRLKHESNVLLKPPRRAMKEVNERIFDRFRFPFMKKMIIAAFALLSFSAVTAQQKVVADKIVGIVSDK